jgi:PAS domain S-box-containing protein
MTVDTSFGMGTLGLLHPSLADPVVALEKPPAAVESHGRRATPPAARRRLAVERARYRDLFDLVPGGCLITDLDGVVIEANLAAAALVGVRRDALAGRPLVELVARRDHRRLRRLVSAAGAGQTTVEGTLRLEACDRAATLVTVRMVRREGAAGEALLGWALGDVTRRRGVEDRTVESLRHARRTLKRMRDLDDLKDLFLLAVSHDVRAPLLAINGMVDIIAGEGGTETTIKPDRLLRIVAAIKTNATHLQRIGDDLLSLDRIARGGRALQRCSADVAALARTVIDRTDTGTREVVVTGRSGPCDVDAGLVERIVENLLRNALQHTPPGTPVTVVVSRGHGEVGISVEDRGAGVREEARLSIYEPFSSAGLDGPTPGAGIGLFLVHRFARLHGGRAWVEDRPGGGACFRVLLPCGSAT